MGHDNVRQVFARWGHLPDPSFRILVYMAMVTLDSDLEPTYFGGREALAFALGRKTPDEPSPHDFSVEAEIARKARRADFRAVGRALTPLFRAEVLHVAQRPSTGRGVVHRLTLVSTDAGRLVAPTQDVSWPDAGRLVARRRTQDVPRDGGGKGGVTLEENYSKHSNQTPNSSWSVNSPGPVDNLTFNDDRIGYPEATEILAKLPDLGAQLLSHLTAIPDTKNRIIAAAVLYQNRNSNLTYTLTR